MKDLTLAEIYDKVMKTKNVRNCKKSQNPSVTKLYSAGFPQKMKTKNQVIRELF